PEHPPDAAVAARVPAVRRRRPARHLGGAGERVPALQAGGRARRASRLFGRRPRLRRSREQHRAGGPLAGPRPRVDGRARTLEGVTEVDMRYDARRLVLSLGVLLLSTGTAFSQDKAAAIESLLKRH